MSLDDTLRQAITETLEASVAKLLRLNEIERRAGEQQLFPEAKAASICGVSACMLKDLRAAGKIRPHRRTRPILYTRAQLSEIVKLLGD